MNEAPKIITRLLMATRKRNLFRLLFFWSYVRARHGLTLPFLSAFDLWTRGKEITNETVKENAAVIIKLLSTPLPAADRHTLKIVGRTPDVISPLQVYGLPCVMTSAWVYSLHTGHRTLPSDADMDRYPWDGVSRVLDTTKNAKRRDVVHADRQPATFVWGPLQPTDLKLFEEAVAFKNISPAAVVVTKVTSAIAAAATTATKPT